MAFEDLDCLTGLLDMAEKYWLKLHNHEMTGQVWQSSDREFDFQGFSRVFSFDTNSESHAAVKAWLANRRQAYGHKIKPSSPRSNQNFALLSGTLYRFSNRQPLIRAASFAHFSAWRQVLHGMD